VWSYDGTDPGERICPARGYFYSLDPNRYRPRCQPCHRRATTVLLGQRDRPPRRTLAAGLASAESAAGRAAWLYARGVSLRGIGEELGISASTAGRLLRAHGATLHRPGGRHRSTTGAPS
jgi:hypothetical protein